MKNNFLIFGILMFALFSCDKDDSGINDSQAPDIQLSAAETFSEPGREFHITGTVTDNEGIASINLLNADWYLDKTIVFRDTIVKNYALDYKFKAPAGASTASNYTIKVTVTDVGGNVKTVDLQVNLNGDFTAPVFTASPDVAITVLIKDETRLNLRFTVEDDKALDYIDVSIPEISYTTRIDAQGSKVVDFSEPIVLPSTAATYNLTIKAVDKFNWTTERQSVISVSNMPDFQKMYLVDVKESAKLNSDVFGIPMLIDRTAAYTYRARYYNETANTEIRFVPQKTDFSPICFGIDPDDNSILTDEPDRSQAIVLPEAKKYYEITFNIMSGEYAFHTYVPTDEPVKIGSSMYLDPTRPGEGSIPLEIGLVGGGLPGAGDWSPAEPLMLTQDADNPYLFKAEMNLEAGATLDFIIQTKHSWGWWPEPFWRWDNGTDPEYNVSNGGENPGKWAIKTAGKYVFKFDSHLLRSRFYPAN